MDKLAILRTAAEAAIRYREGVGDRPQRPLVDFATARRSFDQPLPPGGAPPEAVIEELVRLAEPGLNATTGPRFFGWVIGGSHPVGVAAEAVAAAATAPSSMPAACCSPSCRPAN